ncbi:hypothetical protein CRG98_012928, partial [Punica granatum]
LWHSPRLTQPRCHLGPASFPLSEELAKGRPFLKGRTLKLGRVELLWAAASSSWVLRVSRAEAGLNGSVDFGVLALIGLPAKAWELRLRDMVAAAATMPLADWKLNGGLRGRKRRLLEEEEQTEEDRREEEIMSESSSSW